MVSSGLADQGDKGRSSPSGAAIYSAIVSTIAFLATAFNIYYTQLRPSKVQISPGYILNISYNQSGNLVISTTLAFSNDGAQTDVVNGIKMTITDSDTNDIFDLYEVQYLQHEETRFKLAGFPVPEVVKGGDSFTRLIMFMSERDWTKVHKLKMGTKYLLHLVAKEILVSPLSFKLTEEDMEQIEAAPNNTRDVFAIEAGISKPIYGHP
jgi:hypothetical protein